MTSRTRPSPRPSPASGRGRKIFQVPSPREAGRGLGRGAVFLLALLASCAHKARGPGAAANPIAPVVLPKTNAEAQAAFDEGVRLMKLGKRHYKEARKPLQRATDLDGRLF